MRIRRAGPRPGPFTAHTARRRWRHWPLTVLAALALAGCADDGGARQDPGDTSDVVEDTGDTIDTGDTSAPPDTADAGDMDTSQPPPLPEARPGLGLSSGAGTVESPNYRMRLVIGGPTPTATSASDNYRARIGVAAPQVAP